MEGLTVILINARARGPLAFLASLPIILAVPIRVKEIIIVFEGRELRMRLLFEPERIVP